MNGFVEILRWVTINIFGEASILIGMIVLLGLVLQGKPLADIVSGTLKGILGFLIIGAGASIIVSALLVFQPIWTEVFGLEQMTLSSMMGQARFAERFGSSITVAIAAGFAINLLLARLTRFKYIYLTGHMMFWTAMVFGGVIVNQTPDIPAVTLTLVLSVILGVYWTFQPAIVQPWMRRITGNDNVALGHTSASVALLGALAGNLFARNKISAEDIRVPKNLGFLRDSNVVTALTMTLLFFVGTLLLQARASDKAHEILASSGDLSFYIYALKQSLLFTGGIAVVLLGVRMFIGEMVPAFNGIGTRLVPGARPALDCPIIFNFAPNAVVLGFVGAFVGSLLWLVVIGTTTGYVFIPSMIVIFFHAGTAGVFGNVTGGYKGALLAGFITASVVAWGQYVCVSYLISDTIPDTALWAGDSDMFVLAPLIAALGRLLGF
ncbi:PTS ascorbate transporter subunit IIC [Affinibrenneria salicis]|uniref:Ascorbate-specific PTS system EIIC component n=1 Tax=Affinibrenneria salicis TaxID=2590031 RepID=A0A5J5FZ05_9GAMM|nr:PTS ascorbate transporter subunit IIC [Affinibrenneria salicis]KAA8998437.1 PTS ascorbate transporter subunit IIC [Affinibrenneria salicis]